MNGYYNGFNGNNQRGYGQTMPHEGLSVAYVDPVSNTPLMWVDAGGNIWAYDNNRNFVNVDQQGNIIPNGLRQPVMQQMQNNPYGGGTSYYNGYSNQNQGYPSSNRSNGYSSYNRPSQVYGGNNFGNRFNTNTNNNNMPAGGGSKKFSKFKNNQQPVQQMQEQRVEQVVEPEERWTNLTLNGYKPLSGNEFIPLYDEEKEYLDIVVDTENKTFNFIILKKDRK